MQLGKNILELRKQNDITQEALAAELGVTAAAVSKWENGYTLPDVLMLCALADYFHVTTDALLGRLPKPLCAAVAAVSLPLGQKIAELVKRHGLYVKHIFYGELSDALDALASDSALTHLFVSYDRPIAEHEWDKTNVRTVESHAETEQAILDGFELYLKHMPDFNALAQNITD